MCLRSKAKAQGFSLATLNESVYFWFSFLFMADAGSM